MELDHNSYSQFGKDGVWSFKVQMVQLTLK